MDNKISAIKAHYDRWMAAGDSDWANETLALASELADEDWEFDDLQAAGVALKGSNVEALVRIGNNLDAAKSVLSSAPRRRSLKEVWEDIQQHEIKSEPVNDDNDAGRSQSRASTRTERGDDPETSPGESRSHSKSPAKPRA